MQLLQWDRLGSKVMMFRCPLCKSEDTEKLAIAMRLDQFNSFANLQGIRSGRSFEMLRCKSCGMLIALTPSEKARIVKTYEGDQK